MKKNEGRSAPRICRNCEFWKPDESGEVGECRRFPPQLMKEEDQAFSARPPTDWDDYCGEFKQKFDA